MELVNFLNFILGSFLLSISLLALAWALLECFKYLTRPDYKKQVQEIEEEERLEELQQKVLSRISNK